MTMEAYEITEVEPEQMSRSKLLVLLAKAAGKSIGSIIIEDMNRAAHEEFWSDPCWTE